jgi:hypothetical protein
VTANLKAQDMELQKLWDRGRKDLGSTMVVMERTLKRSTSALGMGSTGMERGVNCSRDKQGTDRRPGSSFRAGTLFNTVVGKVGDFCFLGNAISSRHTLLSAQIQWLLKKKKKWRTMKRMALFYVGHLLSTKV